MDDVTGWELTLQTQGNDLKLSHVLEEIRVEMHGGGGEGGQGVVVRRGQEIKPCGYKKNCLCPSSHL